MLEKDSNKRIWRVDEACCEASAVAVLSGGICWAGLLQAVYNRIQRNEIKGVLLLQKFRYDETPLRVRLCGADPKQAATGLEGDEVCAQGKVLQVEMTLYLLFKETITGKHFLISGAAPSFLQVMERTTGECTVRALENVRNTVPEVDKVADAFQHRLRVAVPLAASVALVNFSYMYYSVIVG